MAGAALHNIGRFLAGDPVFFESLAARVAIEDSTRARLLSLLPGDWDIEAQSIWLVVRPRSAPSLPTQGFKIHVSANISLADQVLAATVRVCVEHQCAFKTAGTRHVHAYLNSKNCPRGNGGKFITIYPLNDAGFVELIDQVSAANAGFVGPYILSDRRYRSTANVFYRYGSFARRERLNVDGSRTPIIAGPNDAETEDLREPGRYVPLGVRDPITPVSPRRPSVPLIGNRAEVERVLAFSNAGGIYEAVDRETSHRVVVKEARPWTNEVWEDGISWDAVSILQHEHEILTVLAPTGVAPEPLAYFREWEHFYLVESFVPGQAMNAFRLFDGLALMDFIHDATRLGAFLQRFYRIAASCIDGLCTIHRIGIVLGDVSPNNVLIDPHSLRATFVDFETAIAVGESGPAIKYAQRTFTPGYRVRGLGMSAPSASSDVAGVGLMLLNLLIPIQGLVAHRLDAPDQFIAALSEFAGLESAVRVIGASLLGDVDAAKAHLPSTSDFASTRRC